MKTENSGRFGNLKSVLACMAVAWGATDSIASSTAQYSSTLSSTSGSAQFVEGDAAGGTLSFTVNIVGHAASGMRPVVSADSAVFASPIAIDNSIADQYTVRLVAAPNLAPGQYTGTVWFRLCSSGFGQIRIWVKATCMNRSNGAELRSTRARSSAPS